MLPSPAADPASARRTTIPRRGLWAAALLALGLLAADACARLGHHVPSSVALAVAAMCALAALFLRGNSARLALALAAFGCGVAWCSARVLEVPADHIAHALTPEPRLARVVGIVSSNPEPAPRASGALAEFSWERGSVTRFTLAVHALEDNNGARVPASGTLWVRVATPVPPSLRVGRSVRISGLARAIDTPRNPGERDWARWARAHDIGGSLRVDSAHLIEPLMDTPVPLAWRIERWILERRAEARRAFEAAAPSDDTRALLAALVLGAREDAYDQVDQSFRRIGLSHVVAISGLHVSLAAGALILLVRATGDRPRLEALALACALLLMLLVVPARSPVLRAVLIVAALRAGTLAGRRWDGLNMLGWIACALLLWNPLELWNPGFQLSFGIVAAMIWLVRPVRERLLGTPPDPDHRTAAQSAALWATDLLVAGAVAWLVSAPAIAAHFGNVSILAPLLTLAILPLVLIAVVAGYAAVALHLALPSLGETPAAIALRAGDWMLSLVRAMERLPGAWLSVGWISPLWALAATIAALALLRLGARRHRLLWCALATALALWAAADIHHRIPASIALRIDALDVGDGSAYLLRSGRGAVLFDCGSRYFGIGERTIPDAVRGLRAPRIDTAIISHHDTDHYSGLLDAAEPLGIRRVLVSPQFLAGARADPHGPGSHTLQRLAESGITVHTIARGDTVTLTPELHLEILWPPPDAEFAHDNDASLVALARIATAAGERRLLLTGDIEREAVESLEALHPDLRADIVEVPHHGSARTFSLRFLHRLDPDICIQSSGPSRIGDERWDELKRNRTWLMTAEVGAAAAEIRADGSLRGWGFRTR